jgi:MFS family permease
VHRASMRILALLTVANVMNFYDRALPAVLVEPIKDEFGLTDTHVGVLSASFTVVYAVAGVWLGRMADRGSRRKIMGWGLVAWSVMTAASAGAWSFTSILLVRLGVGLGEASYAPAANSTISDLFAPAQRSRAVGIFQAGIPIGTILAFGTTALIADAFGSWRAPFLVAAIPGLIVAFALFRIPEPERGASDGRAPGETEKPIVSGSVRMKDRPIRAILQIRTMRWLILSGIGLQVANYTVSAFLVPLLQRYYDLSLSAASMSAGIVIGFAALVGLLVSGVVADRASRKSPSRRVLIAGICILVSAPLSLVALRLGPDQVVLFVVLFSAAWFLHFFFHTAAYPAVADVVPASRRSTAMAVFFAAFYLLGGAFGPVVAGFLSDAFAEGGHGVSAEAYGLNIALLVVVPIALVVSAVGLLGAASTVNADRDRALQPGAGDGDTVGGLTATG